MNYRSRILWMVPIYAGNAWLGLMLSKGGIYVDNLREYYEAYVIYNFMMYLLAYVNARPEERPDERSYEERAIDERTHEEILDQERPDEEGLDEEKSDNERPNEQKPNERSKSLQMHHSFPFCCLHDWEMGREFVHKCKHGILQYTAVRSLTSLISFICDLNGVYGEGEFRTDVAFPYLVAVNNLSQFVAMYCLVLFYRANAETLKPIKPIRKFFCIKAVIFFSFFQGVIVAFLVNFGVISSIFNTSDTEDIRNISSNIQDFLICIEMFMAALAHHFSFSYKCFVNPARGQTWWDAFRAMWDVSDVHNDIKEHFDVLRSSLGRRVRGRSASAQGWRMVTERTSLLPETSGTTGGDEPSCSFSNTGETEEDELGVFHSLPYVDNTKNTVSV
ncbi:transmembrane protein 184C isoform X3 [Frieseomelitta varia]|uniref:transmembrane protein 184C isoform X3 n=1 Tax=Frieseomelitta varia TaxID=561572 RepID=UPI001CB683D7|nr:transmembrane protein 184C isoform X3 [Frieseomelitta varia]